MLPLFTEPQNGHASSKAAQGSQQQRWLQGSSTMHASRRRHSLHRLSVEPIPAVGSLAAPLAADSVGPLSLEEWQKSRTCSRALLREIAMASFAMATPCHFALSSSALFRRNSSSRFIMFAFVNTCSRCLKREEALDSRFRTMAAVCRFVCCRSPAANRSLCHKEWSVGERGFLLRIRSPSLTSMQAAVTWVRTCMPVCMQKSGETLNLGGVKTLASERSWVSVFVDFA
ncbi:hypothetical protein BHE74_00016577 [Ensete ventricosum]|nr:hypothetical protein BHE74_00016577 [Ensete ventricosum]